MMEIVAVIVVIMLVVMFAIRPRSGGSEYRKPPDYEDDPPKPAI